MLLLEDGLLIVRLKLAGTNVFDVAHAVGAAAGLEGVEVFEVIEFGNFGSPG